MYYLIGYPSAHNMGTHGSITGKAISRVICSDHDITAAITSLPNQLVMKRTSNNYEVI